MAGAGLNVGALKGPMNAMNGPPHAMNKAAAPHSGGAGDGLPGFAMGIPGNIMSSLGMKAMNPMMGGGVPPGMPGIPQGMPPHHHHSQMMNGPGLPHAMGQMRGMAPNSMNSMQPQHLPPMGQNAAMMGPGPMSGMGVGHQMGQLNMPPQQQQQQQHQQQKQQHQQQQNQMLQQQHKVPGYDEVVPSCLTTVHVGFYMNRGTLDLCKMSDHKFTIPVVRKRKIVDSEDSRDDGGEEVKRKKLKAPPQMPASTQPPMVSTAGAGPGNAGTRPPTTVPDKIKLIQQQLLVLLHAHKCQRREKAANGEQACVVPYCRTMKNVLQHVSNCHKGKNCEVAHCASSRQIITHWKICTRADCPVCSPLKHASRNNPGLPVVGTAPVSQSQTPATSQASLNQTAVPNANEPRRTFDALSGLRQQPQSVNSAMPSAGPIATSQSGPQPQQNGPLTTSQMASTLQLSSDMMSQGTTNIMGRPPVNNMNSVPRPPTATDAMGRAVPHSMPLQMGHGQMTPQQMMQHQQQQQQQHSPMPGQQQQGSQMLGNSSQMMNHMPTTCTTAAITSLANELQMGLPASLGLPMQQQQSQMVTSQAQASPLSAQAQGVMPNRTPTPIMTSGRLPSTGGKQLPAVQTSQQEPMMNGPGSVDVKPKVENAAESSLSSLLASTSGPGSVDVKPTVENAAESSLSSLLASTSTPGSSGSSSITNTVTSVPSSTSVAQSAAAACTTTSTTTTTPVTPSSGASGGGDGNKPNYKVFSPDELRTSLMPILDKLMTLGQEATPFLEPVNPDQLGIPNYYDIIKKPMDLGTIKKKLDTGQYSQPWQFVTDVNLVFENAWTYNKRTSRVYKHCNKLSEVFEAEIDQVMQSLGYCCGKRHTYCPPVLCCYGKQLCTIPRDAPYHSYQNRVPGQSTNGGQPTNDKGYMFCDECFNDFPGDEVELNKDPLQAATRIKKNQFERLKNDKVDQEEYVTCQECGREWHQVCGLYFEPLCTNGFTCDPCMQKLGKKKKVNKFSAKMLPITKMSIVLEKRVNSFIRKMENNCGEVTIRVLSSYDKMTEVKPLLKARFGTEIPDSFPYRAKAIFAFQEIDGVDVCFFGMHVQEYGSSSPAPNTRSVYISYMDSVRFFRPHQFRSAVYHEILIGYLEYAKSLGFTMAHIWACPPSEGDDYIFHCHPPEQKIPKPKRLQEWYKKMLDKARFERVVTEYKDIFMDAIESSLSSAKDMPYFEGDFWPNVIEDSIKELHQEEEKKKREAAEAAAAEAETAMETDEESHDSVDNMGDKKQRDKKGQKKKVNSQRKGLKKANMPQETSDLTSKLYNTMEKHRDAFFVIRLHSQQTALTIGPIVDPDPPMSNELMDGRDAFLTIAREKHYEFSSLRRAKLSTMAFLYELHTQGREGFIYNCNNCKAHVETRYHCTVCEDFDLCVNCYKREKHEHRMEKLGFGIDDDVGSEKQENPVEFRSRSIQRCIQFLVHSCQCRDANCRLHRCQKMKRVVQHTKRCKNKGGCPICKQSIALYCYHAKHCNENKCVVPFCQQLKNKLQQQQLHLRLHQAQMLRRRMATTTSSNKMALGGPGGPPPNANGDVEMVSQPSPLGTGLHVSQYNSGKVNPGPPQGAMKAALEAQEMAQMQAIQSRQPQPVSMPGMPHSMGKPHMAGMQPPPPGRPSGGKPAAMGVPGAMQGMLRHQSPAWSSPDQMGGYSMQWVTSAPHMQGQMPTMRMNMPPMQQQMQPPPPHPGVGMAQQHQHPSAGPKPPPSLQGVPHPHPSSLQTQLHPSASQMSGPPQGPHPQQTVMSGGGAVGGQQQGGVVAVGPNAKSGGHNLAQLLAVLKNTTTTNNEVLILLKKYPALMSQVLKMKQKPRAVDGLQAQQQQQQQQQVLNHHHHQHQQQLQQQQMPGMGHQTQQVKPLPPTPSMQQQHQLRYQMIQQMRQQQMQQQQAAAAQQQYSQGGQVIGQWSGSMRLGQPPPGVGFGPGDQHSLYQHQQQMMQAQQQQAQLKHQMVAAAAAQRPLNNPMMGGQGASPSQIMQQVRSPPGQVPWLPQTALAPAHPFPHAHLVPSPGHLQSPHHILPASLPTPTSLPWVRTLPFKGVGP